MTLTIVIIAAVTVVLVAALVCSAITIRPKTPCWFDHTIAIVGEYRIGDGSACGGNVDNMYRSALPVLASINGARSCDRHARFLLEMSDAMVKQSSPLL